MSFNLQLMISELTRDEGYRKLVYDDATGKTLQKGDTLIGYPTIGIGRNLLTNGVELAEAKMLLLNDINLVTEWMDKFYPWWNTLSDGQQRALINMVFNLGTDGFKGFRMFLAKMQAKDFDGAAAELEDSLWFKQVGVRAQRIQNLIKYGG